MKSEENSNNSSRRDLYRPSWDEPYRELYITPEGKRVWGWKAPDKVSQSWVDALKRGLLKDIPTI
jgi:hypothetical protein